MRGTFGTCYVVPVDVQARCDAAQSLVAPFEVSQLASDILDRWGDKWTSAGAVGRFLRWAFYHRKLTYFRDPPMADLWCSPQDTLNVGGGDCDDLAILSLSILLSMGVNAYAAIGYTKDWLGNHQGHMWIEGWDEQGFFVIEATNGEVMDRRPRRYVLMQRAHPNWCDAVA